MVFGRMRARLSKLPAELTEPGALAGLLGFAAAYTPSLLPRTWYFQGLIAGLSAAAGSIVGFWHGKTAKALGSPSSKLTHNKILQLGIAALFATGLVTAPLRALRTERANAEYVGHHGPKPSWAPASAATAWLVFRLLLAQAKAIAWLINKLSTKLDNKIAWRLVSQLVASLVVLATILVIFEKVVIRGVIGVADVASSRVDRTTPPNVYQPKSALHSGSPNSPVSWQSLGLQGKRFTCAGPDRKLIAEVMDGLPTASQRVLDPIRAYASMNGRPLEKIIDQVIAELDRTDAWSRKAILLITTTGRGNANEWSTSAFEYLMAGDCATAAIQYSGLPSAVTMIGARNVPIEASKELFARVEARIATLPPNQPKPKIYLAGESLGAFGSAGIFEDLTDLLNRADGAVWTGSPYFADLHQRLTDNRDAGSTTVLPVYQSGRNIRFAMTGKDLVIGSNGKKLAEWRFPRFVYLQNDTDPVVWWGAKLLWKKPIWLKEMAGTQTPMGRMRWWPFVTFWQVAADMPVCRLIGAGYGHKYHARQCVPAWAGVLGLDTQADYTPLIEQLQRDVPPLCP